MISGPTSLNVNPLDYKVWEQCWSLNTSCNRSQKTVPKFKNALEIIWSALLQKGIDNAVKDYRKRLQACVSANGEHFEHLTLNRY